MVFLYSIFSTKNGQMFLNEKKHDYHKNNIDNKEKWKAKTYPIISQDKHTRTCVATLR